VFLDIRVKKNPFFPQLEKWHGYEKIRTEICFYKELDIANPKSKELNILF
jgi:hypothetical protein